MKLTVEQFITVVRGLPLSTNQLVAAEAAIAASAPNELPKDLIRREVLTEFQARLILAGRGADLTVGRYVLLSELGAGGMGTVFKARDTAMDRVVALKLIRDERLANPAALARFQQEVRAAARLAHPNIVRAYDAGTANGRHFLVTELVAGHDLGHELARRGALSPGEACEYTRQAAVGLQHAHEQGLTHRDIKPSNLLFGTADRTVKVADFGLARVGEAGANGLTADGSVMGTPDYIAPEQASSATSADIRSDLYSLGCTLYHFLTGHVPFPADSAYAKLLAHSREEPEPLDDACPGLNPALIEVVRKLMAKNPVERYQTPLEAAEALIPFCPKPRTGTTSVVARPATAPPPVPSAVPVAPASASAPVVLATPSTQNTSARKTLPPPLPATPDALAVPEPQSAPKRSNAVALAGIGGGVLVLVVLVVVLTRGGNSNTNTNTNQNNVNVSVNLDDWAKAREPGVILILDGKERALADFAKLELPPGHHVVVAKKDGKELEARAFDVKDGDAGKALKAAIAPVPIADAPAGLLRQWDTSPKYPTDIAVDRAGSRFAVTSQHPESNDFHRSAFELTGSSARGRWEYAGRGARSISATGNGDLVGFFQASDNNWQFRSINLQSFDEQATDATVLTAGGRQVSYLLFSPDGTRLLYSFFGYSSAPNFGLVGTVHLQKVTWTDGKCRLDEVRPFPGQTACFDPQKNHILVAKGSEVLSYNADTGVELNPPFSGPKEPIACIAVSRDGASFATGGGAGEVYIWDRKVLNPRAVCKGHTKNVMKLAFVPSGNRLVTASEDGTVRVWDAQTGRQLHSYPHNTCVNALAIVPNGKQILTGAGTTIRLWQLPP